MSVKIRGPFGKELDLSEFAGVDVREVIAPIDQLQIENPDPAYVYGWLDTGDPATALKIRRGVWEPVREEDLGGTRVPYHTGSEDGYVHVRELMLVRMPKEKWEAIQRAYKALTLQRHVAAAEAFVDRTKDIARTITPDADPETSVHVDVEARKEAVRRRR